ncbi:hypothetical protein HQP04_02415 [Rhodococcus fascians]|jgi:hypothetical protein|uniref:hypothetical protein n=1 Tax=Nocardiaceae TaxID=85025 RepID=UPI00050C55C7|nr:MULTISPECIES: hypothetical protein [Rhodococcus]MBY4013078.1 hypothetical protein [Rhodococcus fascians]OZD52806.1 hypothetical protein CH252_13155 [Rhodococcus sp. 06-1477-1B]AMY52383.1 hypothetical protein A3L23_01031 [Rhodococcus fascians D188]MBY4020859.1 hypothetical protein [Rhodococcus fascians]MBY4207048.1 hypothetical protein [Rhodococcus fascians]
MRQIKHPMSHAIYEFDDDFNVLVTDRHGKTGTFDPEGRYLHGEVKAVDPELARWVGLGPREPVPITQNRRFMGAAKLLEKMQSDRLAEEARAITLEQGGKL